MTSDNPLNIAIEAWMAGADLRQRRRRHKNYTYGRQWDDIFTGLDGRKKTEFEFAMECGHRPKTNNLLRQMVKTIIGLWRRDIAPDHCGTDAATATRCALAELDARMLEEFLISGCAVQRVVTERRTGGEGVWVDNVSPERFFVSPFTDPRGMDIEAIGMIHDFSLREATIRFGDTAAARRRVESIYKALEGSIPGGFDTGAAPFLTPRRGRCRSIELWTLESRRMLRCLDPARQTTYILPAKDLQRVLAENRRRDSAAHIIYRNFDTVRWLCRWMAPDGSTLDSYLSPWGHASHPFAVKYYPLTDGEVHPFVEDVIDQQRTINRLITLLDTILSVSAKGVLLYPTECLPHGMSVDQLASRWSQPGSIIPYQTTDTGAEPRQISGPSGDSGANALLNLEMQLFDRISGVNSAIQGRDGTVNTSAALYDARTRNATNSLVDVLESYASFIDARNRMIKDC